MAKRQQSTDDELVSPEELRRGEGVVGGILLHLEALAHLGGGRLGGGDRRDAAAGADGQQAALRRFARSEREPVVVRRHDTRVTRQLEPAQPTPTLHYHTTRDAHGRSLGFRFFGEGANHNPPLSSFPSIPLALAVGPLPSRLPSFALLSHPSFSPFP